MGSRLRCQTFPSQALMPRAQEADARLVIRFYCVRGLDALDLALLSGPCDDTDGCQARKGEHHHDSTLPRGTNVNRLSFCLHVDILHRTRLYYLGR